MPRTKSLSRLQPLLISTKFEPPRIGARYVTRAKLLTALKTNRDARITFISGSPGFGKTVLLAQWRQELMKAGARVAWLSLGEEESALAPFSAHLFEAFDRLGIAHPGQLLATDDMREQIEEAAAVIIESLMAAGEDLYLLIDDYHHVTDAWANRLVQKLIDHNPGNLRLIIASRVVPQLSVAKRRVMGQVAEIDCNDLPFSLAETRAFLERNLGADPLSQEETSRLHDLTFGWPATLQLAAILFKNDPESRDRLRRLRWQSADLHSYLIEEVLRGLPPDLLTFMEILAACNRFNSSLARAVTDDPRTDEWLARIVSDNLLVIKSESDDPSGWMRFHPLLADFLSARLATRGQSYRDTIHHRAARWFDDQGLPVEAIRHYMKGHQPDAAIRIADTYLPNTWRLSHIGALLHLVRDLPVSQLAAHPRLAYLGSLSLAIAGAPQNAEAWAEHIRVEGDEVTTNFRRALVRVAVAVHRDDIEGSLKITEGMVVPAGTSAFERSAFLAYHVTALAADGRFAEAREQYRRYPLDGPEADDAVALLARGCWSVALSLQGKASEALPVAAQAYQSQVARGGRDSVGANVSAVTLAELLFEANRIDEAQEMLSNRRHSLRQSPPFIMVSAALTESRLRLLRDATEEAMELVTAEAERFATMGLDRGVAYMLLAQWRLHRVKRSREAARRLEQQLDELATRFRDSRGFNAEIPLIAASVRGRAALWDGEAAAAAAAIDEARAIAERLGRGRWLVTLDLLGTVAADKRGDEAGAAERLRRALSFAASNGLFRTVLEEGQGALALIERYAARDDVDESLRAYAMSLLAEKRGRGAGGENAAPNADGGVLTPRELDIVRLVEAGMSNKRIANTLAISLETVKWNLRNIFLKLEVSCRYDAMIQARRSGLLE